MVETRIQTEVAVAVAGGPAVIGAGDSVGVETGLRPVREIAEAGGPAGTGAGSPVMIGNQFLAVADVHAWFENREDDPPKFELVPGTITEVTRPQPLRQADVRKEVTLKKESGSGTQNRLRSDRRGVGRRPSGISFPPPVPVWGKQPVGC